MISSGLASAFVFCTLLAVQSVLVTIARGRWVHRLIVWGQFAAVILLLQMVIFRGTMVREPPGHARGGDRAAGRRDGLVAAALVSRALRSDRR